MFNVSFYSYLLSSYIYVGLTSYCSQPFKNWRTHGWYPLTQLPYICDAPRLGLQVSEPPYVLASAQL